MNAHDIQSLRDWLRRETVVKSRGMLREVGIDFEETDGAKIHFTYPDGSGLCIHLSANGTWKFTVGQ